MVILIHIITLKNYYQREPILCGMVQFFLFNYYDHGTTGTTFAQASYNINFAAFTHLQIY